MRAAVFLDRDATILEGQGRLSGSSRIKLLPGVTDVLKKLQQDFELFILTNHPCAAEKSLRLEHIQAVNRALDEVLESSGIHIREWYVCPHNPDEQYGCNNSAQECMLEAVRTYGLSLDHSFMVGDHPYNVCTAEVRGVFGIYLLTPRGKKQLHELQEDKLVFHNLSDAVEWITAYPEGEAAIQSMIQEGAHAIRKGGLTAFPTETVYGLGADALNENAVRKIYEVKKRPLSNPLIVHVAEPDQVGPLVKYIDEQARSLMEALWPGPLTLILPKSEAVPDIVTAGLPNVAIRMPAGNIARSLIKSAGTPLAAPSANAFGRISPTTAEHVRKQLEGGYDVLIDGGACRVGVESTVLSLLGDKARILRPGGVTKEQIETITGPVEKSEKKPKALESPGMLPSHYAPRTPMLLFRDIPHEHAACPDVGFLLFQPPEETLSGPCEILSPEGNLEEAAIHLYAALQRLDARRLKLLIALSFPEKGIGIAINDRLQKAANGAGYSL